MTSPFSLFAIFSAVLAAAILLAGQLTDTRQAPAADDLSGALYAELDRAQNALTPADVRYFINQAQLELDGMRQPANLQSTIAEGRNRVTVTFREPAADASDFVCKIVFNAETLEVEQRIASR